MIRLVVFARFLPFVLLASSFWSVASASKPSDVGFVLSSKSHLPETLNARLIYGEHYRGPGIATGRSADIYKATWLIDGKAAVVGVGMEVENALAIGWCRVKD